MAAGRSAKAGTSGGGVDVRRRWGEEVTSTGAAMTGGEGGDVGRWRRRGRAEVSASRGWEGERREQRLGGEGIRIEPDLGDLGRYWAFSSFSTTDVLIFLSFKYFCLY